MHRKCIDWNKYRGATGTTFLTQTSSGARSFSFFRNVSTVSMVINVCLKTHTPKLTLQSGRTLRLISLEANRERRLAF